MNNPDYEKIWSQIKESLISKNADNKPLQMWFKTTQLIEIVMKDNISTYRLGVPTELHKYWISHNLLNLISEEISDIYKNPFQIELDVVPPDPDSESEQSSVNSTIISSTNEAEPSAAPLNSPTPTVPSPQKSMSPPSKRNTINLDYTFSTFVVGRNNEFAHAASYNIAENPGAENYNPLFICGPTGMGKTHLLNAVGNHIKAKFPHLTIYYRSAEKFLNECISSIRRNEMHKFRNRYRENCNVLLMDDIQILGRGEAVQEEFFHTLNDFFEKGQQVIVASDRMPKDIRGLEDRIRTRLEWGLIADIQMPDIETRVAILRYKAEQRSLYIPQDVITYIARISKRSIRELEGNLNKVKMFSELQGLNIKLDLARQVLANHDETKSISVQEIQKIVAEHCKVRIPDMKSKSRNKPLVVARQISMHLIKKHLNKSLVEIGRAFGGKDHTTVLHALRRIQDQQANDSDLRRDIEEIEYKIHIITGV